MYIQLSLGSESMDIVISNTSDVPIYEQIVRQIQGQILADNLKEGEALPSIRLLARELRISVIPPNAPMKNWSAAVFW